MSKSLTTFYRASIKNNCPECFSTSGLEVLFKQEWEDSLWYKRTTDRVEEVLTCHHCQARIYPIDWTDDIERVYAYHVKLAQKESYFKLKPLSWLLLVLMLSALIATVVLMLR